MKKFYQRIFTLSIGILALLFSNQSYAQNAKSQWINNSAAVNMDTIDIYMNGTKIVEDLLFRSATAILSTVSGSVSININAASSIDSGDQVISRHNITLQDNSNNTFMVTGVDNPANYTANPSGRDISIQLINRKGVIYATTSSSNSSVAFYNGTTDNSGFNLTTRPTGSTINLTKMKFMDTTGNIIANSVETYLDIKDTTGLNVLKSYLLPLQSYSKKGVTVFTSGFMDPLTNQNGAPFGMYIVDSLGGTATALKEASRIQFVNNSPDKILDSVDIWLNNTKHTSKLGFRKATNTATVLSGTYDITITKKNSPDTIGTNVVYRIPGFTFVGGSTYLGMITGVVDTNIYKTNPEGINRSFALNMIGNFAEYSNVTNQTSLYLSNGIPDAGPLSLDRNPASPVSVVSPTSYNTTAASVNLTSSSIQIIMEKSEGKITNSYRLNLSAQSGRTGVLFFSGFLDTLANNSVTAARSHALCLAFNDGSVFTLTPLVSKIQAVHASADISISAVKLFINGNTLLDTFKFRTATKAMQLTPYNNYRFHLSPLGSADTTTAIYSFNITPDSGKYYYAIATGLVSTSGYANNPDNVDRSFTVIINANGREKATVNNKNVDLLYFNSISDAPATTAKGIGQTLYLSKNNKFKAFHGYNAHSAFDNIYFDVLNAYDNSILFTALANLGNHKGMAGLVTATGFLNPANNNNGDTAMLFVSWPDGITDSLPSPFTGLKQTLFNQQQISVYPVPATDILTVELHMLANTNLQAELTDLTGRTILSNNYELAKGKAAFQVQLQSINTGFYLLKLQAGSQVFNSKINIIR